MKILTLNEENHREIGEYGPACEGFVDAIKSLFSKKNLQKEKAAQIHGARYKEVWDVDKDLERDLKNTYDNPGWVATNLEDTAETIHVPGLVHANVFGKMLTRPLDILHAAQNMLAVVKDIDHKEKPHTDLRKRLCNEAEKIKNAAELDKFWEKHAKELSETPVDRMRKLYKKPMPALGFDDKKNTFPFDFSDPRDATFAEFARVETAGDLEAPTKSTARDFAETMRGLMEVAIEANQIAQNSYITYWDAVDENVEYDDLEHGDLIFNHMFSGQGGHEVADLAFTIEYELGPILCGLYIAMFDKALVKKEGE